MGTRLTIKDEQDNILYYGSKLVGYVDAEELSCIKYLWDIRKNFLIKEFEVDSFADFADVFSWAHWVNKVCKLSISELKEFLKRYDEDLCVHEREYYIAEEVEKSIPADVKYVWIEWG